MLADPFALSKDVPEALLVHQLFVRVLSPLPLSSKSSACPLTISQKVLGAPQELRTGGHKARLA